MKLLNKFFGPSPFADLHQHTKKVHQCVELVRPLAKALVDEDYAKIEELHNLMSKTEHEADQIKDELRDKLCKMYFLSVGRLELSRFLAYQDDVADAAEDFAVVLLLRKTKMPAEIKEDFLALVEQVISVSELLLNLAEKLSTLAEVAFRGSQAQSVLEAIEQIGQQEWQVDRLERRFARRFYSMEDKIDTTTLIFLDKYCKRLSIISNNAEKTAKYLRLIIRKR